MDSMQEVVNTTTVSVARERTMVKQGDNCLRESYVHKQCIISDSTPNKTMNAIENPSDDSEDSACLSTSQFVPLISYLSPTHSGQAGVSLSVPHQAKGPQDGTDSSLLQRHQGHSSPQLYLLAAQPRGKLKYQKGQTRK